MRLRSLLSRAPKVVRSPGDIALACRMAWFIRRLPAAIERNDVATLMRRYAGAPRPAAADIAAGYERIARLRNALLRRRLFRAYDTCYVRAFTLQRFLDGCGGTVTIHLGVEPAASPSDRLRGHAWVEVDGRLLEGPDAAIMGRVLPFARALGTRKAS